MKRAISCCGFLALSASAVFAQSPTFVRSDYPFLGNTHVVADFNGDGRLDLAGSTASGVAIMLGNGDGTFQPKVEYPVAGQAQDLAAADFNSDGRVDLAVTIDDPRIGLSLLTGNGNGTFNAPINFANSSGFDGPAIIATDLDNDGRADVVIGHQIACFTAPCRVAQSITVMRGNGDGTFQAPQEITVGSGTAEIAVGDFNRDGLRDLALASDSSRVYILLGLGNGTFNKQPTLTLTPDTLGVDATDIDVADLNGDTIEDLVVAIALNGSRTAILIGNGDGTFRAPSIITEPRLRIPQYQAVADYNRDGALDLALSLGMGSEGLMEIRNGNGDGTFQAPVVYLVPPPPSSISGGAIATADFNADGKPDLALAVTGASPALIVLRNATGSAPPPPPPPPATKATLTVTATGRSGERITSSPSGINVLVGTTGSASFTTGTSITLSVSNGREAVWSGACSSGGNRRRTCTFTLKANASVTASIR